jgi:hypothetical protein
MGFIKIDPIKNKQINSYIKQVRVVFAKIRKKSVKDGYTLTIYIGKEIADRLKFVAGDKVSIAYDDQNNRKVLIEKSEAGYPLVRNGAKEIIALKTKLNWLLFTPKENDLELHEIKYEFTSMGGLVLSL